MECSVEAFILLTDRALEAIAAKNYVAQFYYGELKHMCANALGIDDLKLSLEAKEAADLLVKYTAEAEKK